MCELITKIYILWRLPLVGGSDNQRPTLVPFSSLFCLFLSLAFFFSLPPLPPLPLPTLRHPFNAPYLFRRRLYYPYLPLYTLRTP